MNQFNYRPAANPVDTFAAPEVRMGSGGRALAELANSLKSLSPRLDKYAQLKTAEERTASIEEAYKFVLDNQLQNAKDLKAMVEAGKLDENANPLKTKTVKSIVAKREFTTAAGQVEAELAADPELSRSDDLGRIQSELTNRLNSRLGELDAGTAASLAGDYENFVSASVQRHGRRRLDEREGEAQEAFMSELSGQLLGSAPALSAMVATEEELAGMGEKRAAMIRGLADETIAGLQGTVNSLELTTAAPKVRRFAAAAIVDAAIGARDPRVAEILLSRITVAGEPLSSIMSPADMVEIRDKVERVSIDHDRMTIFREDAARKESLKGAFTELQDAVSKGGNALTSTIDMSKLDVYAQQELTAFRRQLAEGQAEDLYGKAVGSLLAGNYKGQEVSFHMAFHALSYPGQQALQRFEEFKSLTERGTWGVTNADTKVQLDQIVSGDGEVKDKRDVLVMLAKTGSMSENDFNQTYSRIMSQGTPNSRLIESLITKARAEFTTFAMAGLMQDPANTFQTDFDKPPQLRPDLADDLNLRVYALDTQLWSYLSSNPDATEEEITTFVTETIDTASSEARGFTREGYANRRERVEVIRDLASQPILTRFKGQLTVKDGVYQLHTQSGAVEPYPYQPRFFQDPADVADRVRSVLLDLGISENPEEVRRLFMNQIQMLDKRKDKQLIEQLQSDLNRVETYIRSQATSTTKPTTTP